MRYSTNSGKKSNRKYSADTEFALNRGSADQMIISGNNAATKAA